jgi:ABC-type dipeptide/oligopeptide/nickel transport system ATPase component
MASILSWILTAGMEFDEEQFRQKVRWVEISLVPQAATNSLNPVIKVGTRLLSLPSSILG